MRKKRGSSFRIYMVFADVFMLLFTSSLLMIGNNIQQATATQVEGKRVTQKEVLSLVVDNTGQIYTEKARRVVTTDEIEKLLVQSENKSVVVSVPGDMTMSFYGELQHKLENAGALKLSYSVEKSHGTDD